MNGKIWKIVCCLRQFKRRIRSLNFWKVWIRNLINKKWSFGEGANPVHKRTLCHNQEKIKKKEDSNCWWKSQILNQSQGIKCWNIKHLLFTNLKLLFLEDRGIEVMKKISCVVIIVTDHVTFMICAESFMGGLKIGTKTIEGKVAVVIIFLKFSLLF